MSSFETTVEHGKEPHTSAVPHSRAKEQGLLTFPHSHCCDGLRDLFLLIFVPLSQRGELHMTAPHQPKPQALHPSNPLPFLGLFMCPRTGDGISRGVGGE